MFLRHYRKGRSGGQRLRSALGQSEKPGRSAGKSGLPPTLDIALHRAN